MPPSAARQLKLAPGFDKKKTIKGGTRDISKNNVIIFFFKEKWSDHDELITVIYFFHKKNNF